MIQNYEHIYSIETYDDDAPMLEIADYDTTVNKSQGMPSFFAVEKLFVYSCVCRRSIIYGHLASQTSLFWFFRSWKDNIWGERWR